MSTFLKIAQVADRIGLRPLVAKAASMAYPASRFEVDDHGRWVNRQPEATFVSPIFHTTSFAGVKQWVLYNWAWQYQPKPGDTVIDVGAGVGEEAVVFSQLVGPNGRVISIEAHPGTFACLQQTIERSGLTNVTPVWCAVSDADGELMISDAAAHLTNSVIGQTEGIRVPARSLDSLAQELGLGEIALIKMNIEGAERPAVKGMKALARHVRNAVISCHDFVAEHYDGGPDYRTKAEVRPALEAMGFAITTRPDAPESWVRDYLYGINEPS